MVTITIIQSFPQLDDNQSIFSEQFETLVNLAVVTNIISIPLVDGGYHRVDESATGRSGG